jgi:fermentation-respiration switch protein FrsA (DUF1100 family)
VTCPRSSAQSIRSGCSIKVFSETDFTEDLKKFDVPTLVVHGDDDQIVPIGASARMSSKLVEGATLKVYPGRPERSCRSGRSSSDPSNAFATAAPTARRAG